MDVLSLVESTQVAYLCKSAVKYVISSRKYSSCLLCKGAVGVLYSVEITQIGYHVRVLLGVLSKLYRKHSSCLVCIRVLLDVLSPVEITQVAYSQ